jgi:hypothetical protein
VLTLSPVAYLALQPQEYCYFDAYLDETDCYDSGPGSFGGVGAFLLFNCVWTILTLAVLMLVPLCLAVHPIAVAVLDGLAMLLWFSGAIGFAVIAAGYAAIPDAMIALAFIIWGLFVATFVLTLMIVIRGGSSGPNMHSSYASHPPAPAFNQYQGPPGAAAGYYQQNPELAHA